MALDVLVTLITIYLACQKYVTKYFILGARNSGDILRVISKKGRGSPSKRDIRKSSYFPTTPESLAIH